SPSLTVMLDYLCGWLALLLAALPGFLFLQTIDRQGKLTLLEKVPLSYGLGLGMIAWEMLVLQLADIRFSFTRIWVPLIGSSLGLWGLTRLYGWAQLSKTEAKISLKGTLHTPSGSVTEDGNESHLDGGRGGVFVVKGTAPS